MTLCGSHGRSLQVFAGLWEDLRAILAWAAWRNSTMRSVMSHPTQIDLIADRVERLMLRYAELQRTNALLASQLEAITAERDSLKSRLAAARARVDALIERLPANSQKDAP